MKQATGDLNSTVIVVIAVAILAAFFFSYLWPIIKNNFDRNSKCSAAVCGYRCNAGSELIKDDTVTNGSINCCYNKTLDIVCAYKG
jgi:hypothetical protein